ncbi:ATPase, T2SS/T4P/T4SS family [Flavobacterium sp.]|uniref:GspE/PulE family protein n=1 Tax=Flavobacterium sp. TaxID=239 RepID=UPI00260E7542|nr:ATPase, T2SS/T4P/T4SS family [Flavobacterium sp.]
MRPLPSADIVIRNIDDIPKGWRVDDSILQMDERVKDIVVPLYYKDGGKTLYRLLVEERSQAHPYVKTTKSQLQLLGIKPAMEVLYLCESSVLYSIHHHDDENENTSEANDLENNQGSNLLKQIVSFAFQYESSDLHCEVLTNKELSQIKFRIMGKLVKVNKFLLPSKLLDKLVAYIFNIKGGGNSTADFSRVEPQQCSLNEFEFAPGRKTNMRVASFPTNRGYKIVIRLMQSNASVQIRSLETLGYLQDQIETIKLALGNKGGGILMSGVVNSGKSTSIISMIDMAPDDWEIYTVEEPIETEIPNATQFQVSRDLTGENQSAFVGIKRQLKRMDLDACFIGEIRDRETAGMFRDVTESGHRAWSTIHAGSAFEVVGIRLPSDELGIPRHVIASPNFLNLVIYQALVPKLCNCKQCAKGVLPDDYLDFLQNEFGIKSDSVCVVNPDGCPDCRNDEIPMLNGIRGRQVVAEMLEIDSIAAQFIRDGDNQALYGMFISNPNKQPYTSPVTAGKFAWEVALYHVSIGVFDPRSVESVFGSLKKKLSDLRR